MVGIDLLVPKKSQSALAASLVELVLMEMCIMVFQKFPYHPEDLHAIRQIPIFQPDRILVHVVASSAPTGMNLVLAKVRWLEIFSITVPTGSVQPMNLPLHHNHSFNFYSATCSQLPRTFLLHDIKLRFKFLMLANDNVTRGINVNGDWRPNSRSYGDLIVSIHNFLHVFVCELRSRLSPICRCSFCL